MTLTYSNTCAILCELSINLMFSEQLISLATDRALGHPTQTECDLFEELYEVYINDSNSSTLREHIVARVAGCNPLPGKLGRDAIQIGTNIEKEIKPKNYTNKTTNGSGCFNDYTRARYVKDTNVNLPIIHGLFVHGILHYVVEFTIDAVAHKLDSQIRKKCEEGGNQYVRSASWTYTDWIDHPSLTVHYINKDLIGKSHVKGQYKICHPFYQKLIAL